jgi:hypothetical protein
MIFRDIEGLKVVEVILDLGPREHLESCLAEDLLDPQARARDRMQAACLLTAARQGDIDLTLGQLSFHRRLFETDTMHLERGLDRRFSFVDALSRSGTLGGRQGAEALELLGEKSFLTEQPHAHLVERIQIRRCVDIGERSVHKRRQGFRCAHGFKPRGWLWLFPRSL